MESVLFKVVYLTPMVFLSLSVSCLVWLVIRRRNIRYPSVLVTAFLITLFLLVGGEYIEPSTMYRHLPFYLMYYGVLFLVCLSFSRWRKSRHRDIVIGK